MKHFLHSLGCLLGWHDPIRDRVKGVLKYRCLHCYADLGPILAREQDGNVVKLSGWRRTPTAVATTLDLRGTPAIARRNVRNCGQL